MEDEGNEYDIARVDSGVLTAVNRVSASRSAPERRRLTSDIAFNDGIYAGIPTSRQSLEKDNGEFTPDDVDQLFDDDPDVGEDLSDLENLTDQLHAYSAKKLSTRTAPGPMRREVRAAKGRTDELLDQLDREARSNEGEAATANEEGDENEMGDAGEEEQEEGDDPGERATSGEGSSRPEIAVDEVPAPVRVSIWGGETGEGKAKIGAVDDGGDEGDLLATAVDADTEEPTGAGKGGNKSSASAAGADDATEADRKEASEEASSLLKGLAVSGREQAEKGEHILAQRALWERLLQLRMALSGPLGLANRMPQPGTPAHAALRASLERTQHEPASAVGNNTGSVSTAAITPQPLPSCIATLTGLLGALLGVQRALIAARHPLDAPPTTVKGAGMASTAACARCVGSHQSSSTAKASSPTPAGACGCTCHALSLWAESTKLRQQRKPERDAILDAWHGRAQGGAPLAAFHQPLSQQIATVLRDRERLLRRLHTNRAHVDPVGSRAVSAAPLPPFGGPSGEVPAAPVAAREASISDASAESSASAAKPLSRGGLLLQALAKQRDGGGQRAGEAVAPRERRTLLEEASVDPQIIDDTDFYQILLRDVIRGSNQDNSTDGPSLSQGFAVDIEAAQAALRATLRLHHARQQKLINRRASKGRAIRYTVSFVAPVPQDLPPNTDALFSNLFGLNGLCPPSVAAPNSATAALSESLTATRPPPSARKQKKTGGPLATPISAASLFAPSVLA